jgi:hypothetical protein
MANLQDLNKHASSIGLLVDRCVKREEPFGTVWLVDNNRVATCAHLVVLFEEFLPGLKVRFPHIQQEWEIVDMLFHPRFDRKLAHELAKRALLEPVPSPALQDHNLVILKLSRELSSLKQESVTTFNKKIGIAPLPRTKGLSGEVDELGLAIVIQTITNSRKDGSIIITDERNRPIAKLFCKEGKILYAKYGQLSNESAVYQMFAQQLSGHFNFKAQTKPDWPVKDIIIRATDSLILDAHRRLDEIPKLLSQLGGTGVAYVRVFESVNLDILPSETKNSADTIWYHLDGGISIDQLWQFVNLDDHSIYQALIALLDTKQIRPVSFVSNDLNPMQPLELAPHLKLAPWDEIVSLSTHPTVGRSEARKGNLVGLLRPNDPWHLLHNIKLPYKAAGSPLLKNDQVIGMHCGLLPLDPKLHALPSHLNQLLWVESIYQCLNSKGKITGLKPSKKSVGMLIPKTDDSSSGYKKCVKCHSSMQKNAQFCGACGRKFN